MHSQHLQLGKVYSSALPRNGTLHHQFTVLIQFIQISPVYIPKEFSITSTESKHQWGEMGEIYCWEKRRRETREGNCNTLSKTLHSHFHSLKRRQIYSSSPHFILTLHSQHVTGIEALAVFLFLSEQKSLQLIAFYPSFTSHSTTLQSERSEHHTALAPNHHFVQCRAVRDDELALLPT